MKKSDLIPLVPEINLDEESGLKNLAGWLARYKNFGLTINEVSSFVEELLKNGTLAKFESSLIGLRATRCGSEEEYERYEFTVSIDDFIDFCDDWAILHFAFKSKKCTMFVESINQSRVDRISPALKNIFEAMDVDPLTNEEQSRDLEWEEADNIILKYLKYINCSVVASPNISK